MATHTEVLSGLVRRAPERPLSACADGVLLERFLAGDQPAFAALLDRHGPMVLGRCRRVAGDHLAEDVFQATFLVLARKGHTVRRRDSLASWLYGVAGRLARQARLAEAALAGRGPGEGRLSVGAVLAGWELDADLVVLSACQTALGRLGGGEGMLGFAHALLQKGARAVVLSRWKVDDTATALLMGRFSENLLGQGGRQATGRAEALAEAKRWLRELPRKELEPLAARLAGGVLRGTVKGALPGVKAKAPPLPAGDRPFAHPYYWAAFVLVGEPD